MMAFDATSEIEDDALMVLYANGDPLAATTLAGRHVPRILSLATRLLRDRAEAEDVAQESLLRLWKIAPDWRRGEAKVSTWLYRVASNLCTDRLRKKRPSALPEDMEFADDAIPIDEAIIQRDRAEALHLALAELPERQRLAVAFRHLEGLSNPEIAAILECSVEAVESLVSRGKRNLNKLLITRKNALGLC